MNKILLYILFFFLLNITAYGQVRFSWDGGGDYLAVNSYSGAVTTRDAATLKIDGNGNVNFNNWKISVRVVNYPVMNGNDVFPADKISFSPIRTWGELEPGPVPTISQIGMPLSTSLQNGNGEVFLVPNSNAALINENDKPQDYFYFEIAFNLVVAPGGYLNALQAWRQYRFTFEYTLYDNNNTVIGKLQQDFLIQVEPLSGTPPSEDQYSIQISTGATNGVLEFKTIADYINGKSITYPNGLTVSSNTNYQVTVRSISSQFSSATGNTLPLEVVHLQLSNSSHTTNPVTLSTGQQTLLQGSSTNGRAVGYDIKYYTDTNDSRLFNAQSDNYSTSLIYEISPR